MILIDEIQEPRQSRIRGRTILQLRNGAIRASRHVTVSMCVNANKEVALVPYETNALVRWSFVACPKMLHGNINHAELAEPGLNSSSMVGEIHECRGEKDALI